MYFVQKNAAIRTAILVHVATALLNYIMYSFHLQNLIAHLHTVYLDFQT